MIGVFDASARGCAQCSPIGAPLSGNGRLEREARNADASLLLGRLVPVRRNPADEKPGNGPRLLDPARKEHP
jgi:hypothetical protein